MIAKLSFLPHGIIHVCKYLLPFSAGVLTTTCLTYISYKNMMRPGLAEDGDTNKTPCCEVRVMGKKSINCRNCVHRKIPCSKTCTYATLAWMVSIIDSAQSQLEVCMYLITYPEFANAVIHAKSRGCRVRLITSREKEDTATTMLQIRRAGVMVRTMTLPSSELMHMKLVIVDGATVLSGSVNYTVSGFSGNAEEVVCIEDPEYVRRYVEWFHLRWADFSYVDRTMAAVKHSGRVPNSQPCLEMPGNFLDSNWV